jgi:inosose dehydratase
MIQIANAPCSWGVLEFDLEGKAAGYQQVLDEIRDTGYEGSELGDWGFMPTDPLKLKDELLQRNLSMIGAFVPVFLKDREAFIVLADDNGKIKERTLNAGRINSSMGLSKDEWKVFAEGTNYVASEIKAKTGLRTVFHHHCAGYVETPEEIDTLLTLTDPLLVGLVLDMGHYKFSGGDPLGALKKYQDRIWHIHFKDCHTTIAAKSRTEKWDYFKSVGNGVFCELGKGSVDFTAILAELMTQYYSGWIVVEQDVLPGMGNPKVCAKRNRDFIKSLGL